MWRLARDAGALEANSAYCYLLMCREFGETCVLAEEAGAPAGFVMAFRPPERPDAVFVWQVGVSPAHRGRGVGGGLLGALARRASGRGVRYLEATVAPSNKASRALFESFARRMDAPIRWLPGYSPELFPEGAHEEETLLRVGPFGSGARKKERDTR